MNIALWIVSGLLALVFLASGAMKLSMSNTRLVASGLPWVEAFSTRSVKAIGILEVLAAVGLILPATFDIAPALVPSAAVGAALLMIGAIVMHVRRREPRGVVVSGILLVLAVVVIIGRVGLAPFAG